jgi:outer membrane protein TolC
MDAVRLSVPALLLALAVRGASAQPPLTLDQVLERTLSGSPVLQAARAGADLAEARVEQARSARLPRVDVTESWQRGDQPTFVFSSLLSSRRFAADNFAIDALNHPSSIGFFRTTAGIDQLVVDGGGRSAGQRMAALGSDIARLGVAVTRADLRVTVTEAFGRVVVAQAARRAAEAALISAREDQARAERRRDAGLATDADALAMAVHVAALEEDVLRADGDGRIARAELARLMGDPASVDFVVADPTPSAAPVPPSSAEVVASAQRDRPEVQQARAAVSQAQAQRTQARSALVPQVAARAELSLAGTSVADRASSWVVGGEARWTLALGGAERARVREAVAQETRARAEETEARARIAVEVETALARVRIAHARLAVAAASVEQAREAQRIVRDRFGAGLAPVSDVLQASSALVDTERRRTAALVDIMTGDATLARARGRAD